MKSTEMKLTLVLLVMFEDTLAPIYGDDIVPREDVFRMVGGPSADWRIESGQMSDFVVGGIGNDVIAGGAAPDDRLQDKSQSPQHGERGQQRVGTGSRGVETTGRSLIWKPLCVCMLPIAANDFYGRVAA